MSNATKQAVVVTDLEELRSGYSTERLALFNEDGTPIDLSGAGAGGSDFDAADARDAIKTKTQVAALTAVTAPNAAVAAGAEPTKAEYDVLVTLANANKAALNAIIAALKA